ncbi:MULTISPECIES: DUF1853 family protein [unclassified Modicisalibacter]|uniref:DUF1853 family protein n=1 Tax=unclassified Modicisalibacter TaxID=2679913 RepID=UPI001CCEF9B0|nr:MULTISPECIES: DUF1853 family protein [unclassified Modicisalibacter]MBZ9560081.1 DUF1853 family protein [Modicisalibacter sp. R2A 31.J]MBZ9575990.1 DUF1853 family protein [Modicisalibacter sp. MOD 31.J]
MNQAPSPSAYLDTLRHPLVRDLAWLLHAPDLLVTPYPGRPTLDELGLGDAPTCAAWLAALEADPAALETALDHRLTGRLGLYHEALWHFLLDRAPATRLLGRNLAVRDAHGATLGELDLIYRREGDGPPVHLELAIKYYLGLADGPGAPDAPARWIGPGCADSLALKHHHALTHQLPMSRRPEARALLAPFGAPPLARRLAILGVLFRPWRAVLPLPRGCAPGAPVGVWLHLADWPAFRATLGEARGAFLDKPHWLAPPPDDALQPLAALGERLDGHFRQHTTPRQLVAKTASGTRHRLFVVADDWPRLVPLAPRAAG